MTRAGEVADRYGYLWKRPGPYPDEQPWHLARITDLIPLERLRGRALDAGCGDGRDAAELARRGCRVVAVDLSEAAARAALARARRTAAFDVIRADLQSLPLAEASFDLVYSYGVLHHLPAPERGLSELVRVLRPGGMLVAYVYEDLAERSALERALLAAVTASRRVSTRLPPPLLYRLCQVASPIAFALLTLPARALRLVPFTRAIAARIPLRHGTGPFELVGDLYDRFATPIERRYGRADVESWLRSAGLASVAVHYRDGWVATAQRV